jgi:hypothetical protein
MSPGREPREFGPDVRYKPRRGDRPMHGVFCTPNAKHSVAPPGLTAFGSLANRG